MERIYRKPELKKHDTLKQITFSSNRHDKSGVSQLPSTPPADELKGGDTNTPGTALNELARSYTGGGVTERLLTGKPPENITNMSRQEAPTEPMSKN